jgi:hypothetical protein
MFILWHLKKAVLKNGVSNPNYPMKVKGDVRGDFFGAIAGSRSQLNREGIGFGVVGNFHGLWLRSRCWASNPAPIPTTPEPPQNSPTTPPAVALLGSGLANSTQRLPPPAAPPPRWDSRPGAPAHIATPQVALAHTAQTAHPRDRHLGLGLQQPMQPRQLRIAPHKGDHAPNRKPSNYWAKLLGGPSIIGSSGGNDRLNVLPEITF